MVLRIFCGIVFCLAWAGLLGCSDIPPTNEDVLSQAKPTSTAVRTPSNIRATVEDIQNRFDSRGFEFELLSFRENNPKKGSVRGVSPDSRVFVIISGDLPVNGANWEGVDLVFHMSGRSPYTADDAQRDVDYIRLLTSLLTPSYANHILVWYVDAHKPAR